MSFEERQSKFRTNKKDSIQKLDQSNNYFDPSTGQEFFKPLTGRPPKNRNSFQMPIGEYLYSKRNNRQKSQTQSHQTSTSSSKYCIGYANSSKIVEEMKKCRLMDIFNLLDSDRDGEISAEKIDISKLESHVLEAFSPLLCEMEELGQSLNFEEFYEASDRLLQTLSIGERNQIFRLPKSKQSTDNNLTFHPSINENSVKIAAAKRPYGSLNIYDMYI